MLKIRAQNSIALKQIIDLIATCPQVEHKVINQKRLYIAVDALSDEVLLKVQALGGEVCQDKQYDLDQS